MADILIVDDDELIRDMIRAFVEDAGHSAREAEDGKIAMDRLQEARADVAIIDVIMPNQEGLETIRHLQRLHPDVAVIAMSGGGARGHQSYLDAALDFGAKAALKKPFTRLELLGLIDRLTAKG